MAFPPGVTLKVLSGASIIIPSGRTFAINGHLDAGPYQIFTDNSADLTKGVKFGGSAVEFVRPEWWGFKTCGFSDATQATANTLALNQALAATSLASDQFIIPVMMAAGTPYIQGGIAPGGGGAAILRGAGAGDINNPGAALFCVHNPTSTILINTGFVEISNLYLALYEGQTKGIYVNNRGTRIRDVYIQGSYNDNDDSSYKIYLDNGSNQSKVRDIHIVGYGGGIYDLCDGGLISNCDLEGPNDGNCTGIFAGNSFIQSCQIQYFKYGMQATTSPAVLVAGCNFQQNTMGVYSPYLSTFNIANSRFGGNQYGLVWLGGYVYGYSPATLTNAKFSTNWKASIVFQGACHGTLSDIDIDIYVGDANFHNRFVGFYPAYLDTMWINSPMKFPVFKNIKILSNGAIQEPVINLYNLTGLNGTFASPYETGLTVTATAGEGQVTLVRSAGSWAAAGLRVNDWSTFSGFTNPVLNGQFKILSVGDPNAQTMVLDNYQPASEGPTASISYYANPSLYVSGGVDFTDTILEGDHVKMTGNFTNGGATNNGWPLTVWQVTADTLRFMAPMTDNAKSSMTVQCPETASSINIERLPHLFGDHFTLRAGSAATPNRLYGIGEGAKITVTLDDSNVTLDKWGDPDMVATKAGAVYTDVTGSTSFTLFPSSPSVDDAHYIGGDFLPSAVKYSIDAAYGGTPPTFDWEYYNGVGGGWAAISAHTVPNFASTGEFITWFTMPVDAIPTRFYDIGADIVGSTNKRKYLYWVRCRITAGGSPTGSVTCDAAVKVCWQRLSTDTFPTSPIGIGEIATLTLENSGGVIKEISRSEP